MSVLPQRRSVRLPGYDYAGAGAYFVTLCTHGRASLFGQVVDGSMRLGRLGRIAEEEWLLTSQVRAEVDLDAFVVMPNHMHMLVLFTDTRSPDTQDRAHGRAPLRLTPRSRGALIAGFKSAVTRRVNALRRTPGAPVWQRNYYERVVRDEGELARIREYIVNNEILWGEDEYNPASCRHTDQPP